MSTVQMKPAVLALPLIAAAFLGGCVSQEEHDALNAKYTALSTEHAAYRQQSEAHVAALNEQVTSQQSHVQRLQSAINFTLQDDMLFASGSWQLSPEGREALAGVAQKLGPYQQSKIVVNGYADNQPIGAGLKRMGVQTNEDLSQRRADAVRNWLVAHGGKGDMISANGLGEADPVATNDTAEGRAKNRRVEITLDRPNA